MKPNNVYGDCPDFRPTKMGLSPLSDPLLAMSYHDLNQEARRLRRANRRLRQAIRRLSEEEGDSAEFALSNAPPKPKPWRGGELQNTRQTVLVAGMDCVAGQQDLFKTDGNAANASDER